MTWMSPGLHHFSAVLAIKIRGKVSVADPEGGKGGAAAPPFCRQQCIFHIVHG